MARRKLEIEIVSAAKGDGFKKSEGDATRWSNKLGQEGEAAGNKLSRGVEKGTEKVSSMMESAGSTASDLFGSGFDVGGIADVISSKLGDIAGKGGKIATAVGGIGIAAGAAFTMGLLDGMETEVSTDKLAAQLGGSEWAQEMGDVAGALYVSGFGESVSETATVLKQVLQQGLLPEDATNAQIEAMTGKVLTFADIMDQDVALSITSVATMLKTGIAKDGTEALDILTAGAQQGGDKMGDLVEVFGEYSTNFRFLGLDGAQAMGLIVQAVDAGAYSADQAADSLREFSVRAVDGSETTAQAFKDLGLDAEDMAEKIAAGGPRAAEGLDEVLDGLRGIEDPLQRNLLATALFGSMSEDMAAALLDMDLDTAAADLGDLAGATEDLNPAYENASSAIEVFKREKLAQLTTFIGQEVLPALQDLGGWFREDLQPALEDLGTWMSTNLPYFADLVAKLGEDENAVKLVAIAVGALTAGFIVLQAAAVAAAIAAGVAWVIAALPILAVIAVIAAVVGAFAYAVFLIQSGLNELGVDFSDVWGSIQRGANAAWDFVWQKASTVLGALMRAGRVVSAVMSLDWADFANAAGAAWRWIADVAAAVIGYIDRAIDRLVRRMQSLGSSLRAATGSMGGPAGGIVSSIGRIFADGGIVKGVGPVPIVAHGGELIANQRQQSRLWDLITSSGPVGSSSSAVPVSVSVTVTGNVYGVDNLYGAINKGLDTGQINIRGRRLQ